MLLRYTNWLIRQHKWIVIATLLIIITLASGIKNLSSTNDFRVYFSKDNPQLVAFETLERDYGKQDSLFFLSNLIIKISSAKKPYHSFMS